MKKKTKSLSDDYDSPWKEIIERYFPEFIGFFFPKAYKEIDWKKGYEFMDKELGRITKDAEAGNKYVDKLVKVQLKKGKDVWALIHADIQSQEEKSFSERMYVYNYRLFDKYRRHAASFAVLGDTGKKWHPGIFEQKLWDCEVRFRFPAVKLSDYANNPESLEKSGNPFAVVVMAHLLALKSAGDSRKRMNGKLTLIRHLYRKNFSKQDIINLFRFIDWIMYLPEETDSLFWEELTELEKENKMPYITSIERIGFKRGIQQGIQQGNQDGKSFIIAKQIARKFKSQAETELSVLKNLKTDDLTELGELIFDFDSLEEVHEWIKKRMCEQI